MLALKLLPEQLTLNILWVWLQTALFDHQKLPTSTLYKAVDPGPLEFLRDSIFKPLLTPLDVRIEESTHSSTLHWQVNFEEFSPNRAEQIQLQKFSGEYRRKTLKWRNSV